jgi:hypothetical protein
MYELLDSLDLFRCKVRVTKWSDVQGMAVCRWSTFQMLGLD